MEDVLTELPPPSRFFHEDLNNFVSPVPILPSPFFVFQERGSNPNPSPDLLIVAISSPSLYLFHHLSLKTLIGALILPEASLSSISVTPSIHDNICNIYSLCADGSILVAAVQLRVVAERAYAFARPLICEIRPKKVLILGSIQPENFRGKLPVDEAVAFKLETDAQRVDPEGSLFTDLSYFPSGRMIDGLGAALLARCQVEKIRGTLCVTWPESNNSAVFVIRSLLERVLPSIDFCADAGLYKLKSFFAESELYT